MITTRLTEDDLMQLGPDVWAEVVDGRLIITWPEGGKREMGPVGFLHGLIAGNVYDVLKPFVLKHKLGYVQADGVIYVLATDDQGIRSALVPDVSFVRKERLLPNYDLSRPFPGAPDLAVEVISPQEAASDILAKVDRYLDAGTQQVWVMYPERRDLHQYTRRGTKNQVQIYTDDDLIDVKHLFPGLEISPVTLFALPDLD